MSEEAFVKVSETEYQIKLNGKFETIKTPYAKVEKVFHAYINAGGVIDPITGQVQTDILTLITSFKEVGNILLTEHDENGVVTKEGNCANLAVQDVVNLFKLSTELIQNFIKTLEALNPVQTPTTNQDEEKGSKRKIKG